MSIEEENESYSRTLCIRLRMQLISICQLLPVMIRVNKFQKHNQISGSGDFWQAGSGSYLKLDNMVNLDEDDIFDQLDLGT